MTLPKQIPLSARVIAGTALIVLALLAAWMFIPAQITTGCGASRECYWQQRAREGCDGIAYYYQKSCRDIIIGWGRIMDQGRF